MNFLNLEKIQYILSYTEITMVDTFLVPKYNEDW